jgi:hypothetical protein
MDLPKMTAGIIVSVKDHPDVHFNYTGEVPKEIMDEFEKIVGNGQAKVSVAVDLSIKDFGTGASAMCSVSLSCNQDQQTIDRAAALAAWAAKRFAVQYRVEAEQEIQNILTSRGQQPPLQANNRPPHYG